jgi:hypothetical protein
LRAAREAVDQEEVGQVLRRKVGRVATGGGWRAAAVTWWGLVVVGAGSGEGRGGGCWDGDGGVARGGWRAPATRRRGSRRQ